MASIKEQKTLESLPWYNKCKLVEKHSFAGVACFLDAFPVTQGHMLFVPMRKDLIEFCFNRAYRIGEEMVATGEWDGFNIGLNRGQAAGQSVKWPHVHLIPRRDDDCKDPVGGIRKVIPGKGNWKTSRAYSKKRKELGIDE